MPWNGGETLEGQLLELMKAIRDGVEQSFVSGGLEANLGWGRAR